MTDNAKGTTKAARAKAAAADLAQIMTELAALRPTYEALVDEGAAGWPTNHDARREVRGAVWGAIQRLGDAERALEDIQAEMEGGRR